MNTSEKNSKTQAFSKIEFVILAVVLSILGAVVVPQFSQARTESKLSDMVSSLQAVRSQIELYRIQHDDLLPGQREKDGPVDPVMFVRDLTERSEIDGFGPYLNEIPGNPFVDPQYAANIIFVSLGQHTVLDEKSGWSFNTNSCKFNAASSKEHAKY